MFDDLLDVVEELVCGHSHHEQSVGVLGEMLVPGLHVGREICGADLTLTVTRQSSFRLSSRLELGFGLDRIVGGENGG